MSDFCLESTGLCGITYAHHFSPLSVTKYTLRRAMNAAIACALDQSVTSIPKKPSISFVKNRDQWFLTTVVSGFAGATEGSEKIKHWRGKRLFVDNDLPLQCFVAQNLPTPLVVWHRHLNRNTGNGYVHRSSRCMV